MKINFHTRLYSFLLSYCRCFIRRVRSLLKSATPKFIYLITIRNCTKIGLSQYEIKWDHEYHGQLPLIFPGKFIDFVEGYFVASKKHLSPPPLTGLKLTDIQFFGVFVFMLLWSTFPLLLLAILILLI